MSRTVSNLPQAVGNTGGISGGIANPSQPVSATRRTTVVRSLLGKRTSAIHQLAHGLIWIRNENVSLWIADQPVRDGPLESEDPKL